MGSHPGDVSALLGGRLVILENKAVEAETSIDFGPKWSEQRAYLLAVEEVGNAMATAPPLLGWVFYGLPLRSGPTFGCDWSSFPEWQHLACPHKLNFARIGGSARIVTMAAGMQSKVMAHTTRPASLDPMAFAFADLRLSHLALACDLGLAGLALPSTYDALFEMLRQVVEGARAAWPESIEANDGLSRPPFFNGDVVFELLQELAALAGAWSGHTALAAFPVNKGAIPEEQ